MKTSSGAVVVSLFAVLSLACTGAGTDPDDGVSSSDDEQDEELILAAVATCDPTANAWDDLFIFEVETVSDVDYVEVDVYAGSSRSGTVNLNERGDGNWYAEEDADDLDADCDDFDSMFFEVFAQKGGTEDSVDINP